jgi:hypothetical protein
VLVVEDLHWSGDDLLDFLDHLTEWASGVAILVVCTARPELLQRRPAWGGGKSNALTISLSPLSDEDTSRLVGELLERPVLDADTQSALLARAGGNPLYAEQYARILLEQGELETLPESVQGIIAARLDLLEPQEKALLQDAAVLGKTFWSGGLASVAGLGLEAVEERVHGLERKDFLRRERLTAVEDETQYFFLHVLVRDVAYGQIPRAERADKHRRAAEWVESLGRPEDHAEMLAHHYLQALALAEAAGLDTSDLVEPARLALRDAGDRAAALYATEPAKRYYEAALRLWPADDPARPELLFRWAAPVRHLGGGDPERLAEAIEALLAVGDNESAAAAEMDLAVSFWLQGRREEADEHAARAATLVEGTPPSRSRVWVLERLGTREMLAGRTERAIEMAREARAAAEQLGWADGLSEALNLMGSTRVLGGDPGGIEELRQSIEVATEGHALGALSRAYNNMAVAHQITGDMEAASSSRLEAARVADEIGDPSIIRWYQGILCDPPYRLGDWREAQSRADVYLGEVEAGSPHYVAWQIYGVRAEMRLACGDAEGAIRDVERSLELGLAAGELQATYFVRAAGTHVFEAVSRPDRAAELARDFLEALASGLPMGFAIINLPVFVAGAVGLGLADELGAALSAQPVTRWTEAARAYASGDHAGAAELYAQIGARPDEAEARLKAGDEVNVRRALEFWRSVGATRYIAEAESLLAASA